MRVLGECVVILLLTLLAAAATHRWHPRAPAWHLSETPLLEDEVSLEIIASRWNNDVLWIDARPRKDYEAAHIPGALLLNEQEADTLLFDLFSQLQDTAKPIVIYCGSEACEASRKIKTYLQERLPLDNLYILRGGWQTWRQHGSNTAKP